MTATAEHPTALARWLQATAVYADRRVIAVLFLGFSSGLPLLLVFSTLSLWLVDEGVSRTAIGLFSLVRTPYTFKFLWAPLIDRLPPPPGLRRLGRRRGWTLTTQAALALAILGMASTDPSALPMMTALCAVLVAFSSASQDIVIDALRIELLQDHQQGAGAGVIVLGYRIGMLTAGAGALYLAAALPWAVVYTIMAACVLVGVVTVLLIPEPPEPTEPDPADTAHDGPPSWLRRAVVAPFTDFMARYPLWPAVLAFIMLYKLCDAYLGVMANPFYVDVGFSKEEIASVSKVFGVVATIVGGILGGLMVSRMGTLWALMLAGILQALSNLVFAVQAVVGPSVPMLMVTIGIENITGGLATAAFVAFLSGLCAASYTATQYALLSSFMAFARDLLASSSGWLAEQVDWVTFFIATAVMALPALVLLAWLGPRLRRGTLAVDPDPAPA